VNRDINQLKAAAAAYAKTIDDGEIVETARRLRERFCTDNPRTLIDGAIFLFTGTLSGKTHPVAARSLIARTLFEAVRRGDCKREREEALEILKPHLPG